jgi:hypothetical protein
MEILDDSLNGEHAADVSTPRVPLQCLRYSSCSLDPDRHRIHQFGYQLLETPTVKPGVTPEQSQLAIVDLHHSRGRYQRRQLAVS